MADGNNRPLAGGLSIRGAHSAQRAILHRNTGQRGAKAHLAAVCNDVAPHGAHHVFQDICAHMGLSLFDNVIRRAVRRQRVKHRAAQRVADAGGQLAVRIRARAAFTELDIGFRVERAARPEGFYRAVARVQIAAALQNQRRVAVFGQRIGGKQPCRAQPDHDRPVLQPLGPARDGGPCIVLITNEGHLQMFCKCLFVHRCVQPHRIYAEDPAAACINAHAADHRLRFI